MAATLPSINLLNLIKSMVDIRFKFSFISRTLFNNKRQIKESNAIYVVNLNLAIYYLGTLTIDSILIISDTCQIIKEISL